MAVVNVRTLALANAASGNATTIEGGRHRSMAPVVGLTTGDSTGSVYRLCRLNTWWRILSLRAFFTALTSATCQIGLYRTEDDGGAVVLANAYSAGFNLNSGNNLGQEASFQSRNMTSLINAVWQDAGYNSDPRRMLDLALTLNVSPAASGTVAIDVAYVAD